MLSSITPLGERSRHNRWGGTVAWYVVGSVVGGSTFGAATGALGSIASSAWWPTGTAMLLLVTGVLLVGLLLDLGWAGPIPTIHRQVNEDWLGSYRSWVYGAGFGYQLGLGIVTIVPTSATYVVYILAFLTGSIPAGIAMGATFGLARAVPILTARRATNPAALRSLHRAMNRLAPRATRLSQAGFVIALASVAVSLFGRV